MEEMGHMRIRSVWLIWLLTAGSALYPLAVRGQDMPPADPVYPLPLYHDRPETGGFFAYGGFVMYRQTNPLNHQLIATEGFVDVSGNVTGKVGRFVGSGNPVLFADDAGGPGTYQPGFKVGGGWRFSDGSAIDVSWMNLLKAEYSAEATLARPFGRGGNHLENTFLFAPVFNFPSEFAGPNQKINTPSGLQPLFGIWNGASIMQIQFDQRATQVDATYRVPIYETECWRTYGLVGPRFFWIWERFKWRTVDLNQGTTGGVQNQTLPTDAAIYTNIVSNRMYGIHFGGGNEWYLGHGVALSVDVEGVLYMNIVKERAKFESGERDLGGQAKRAITDYTFVPSLTAGLNFWWYPIEGVEIKVGYDFIGFLNTIAAPNPVSFNFGGLDPAWEHEARWFDGFNASIAFIF
jgi:hypothetical protein